MQLLISIVHASEMTAACEGGADIIDVKNPAEGALGAASVPALKELSGASHTVSAALGEAESANGTWGLAAYGAASLGAGYIKVGLRLSNPEAAITLLQTIQQSAHLANPACRVIAVGYADYERINAMPWQQLAAVGQAARIYGCLIDTAIKDSNTLFDYCSETMLGDWLVSCREAGLTGALAGTLRLNHMDAIRRLAPDVVGFRSAACDGTRAGGRVHAELVRQLRDSLSG